MTATGTLFEGYRLMRPLGRGWLGEVYTAQNLDGAGIAALRIVAPELTSQPQVMTQFRRLHEKWRRLAHPNILKVGELIERDHRMHYEMNLARSGSVRQLLQAQNGQLLDLLVVVDIVRQVASALRAAHDANLMHGDLKPENILLSPARAILGRQAYGVLVSDFGVGELQAFTHGVHDRLIVTTPAYMSPEQCLGLRTEVRSDVYALGVVLYELLTNLVPFETRDLADAVDKHQHVAPIPPGQIRLDIPQDLEEVVLTCLAKAPEYRYRSARELEQALQGVLSALLPQGPSPTVVLPDIPEPTAPRIEPLQDRAPFPRLQIAGADGQVFRTEPLQGQTVTLGRAPGNGIVLEHAGVSRHHVLLEVEDAGVFVTDLASTNGTTLSGQALGVRTRTPWPAGGVLRIEPFWLRLDPPQKVVQQARIGVLVTDNDLTLTPGELTVLKVQLANTGRTVDHFRMEIEGVPDRWVQNLYTELQLNPGMTSETTLRILVPREAQYLAATYPVKVLARSRENPADFGYAPMNWELLPFTETKLELTPRRRSAWRRTHYDLKIVNASNIPVTYNPAVKDDEGQVHQQGLNELMNAPPSGNLANLIPVRTIVSNFIVRLREGMGKVRVEALPQNVRVDAGSQFTHRIQVRLPIRWIASPRQRSLSLHPNPDGGRDYPEVMSLLHLPVVPLWLLPIVVVLGVVFVMWLLQAPSIVTVSVVPIDPRPQIQPQTPLTRTPLTQPTRSQVPTISDQPRANQLNQQPRAGQPFYLDFETRNAARIVVKPWNKTLYRGNGRLLIPEGIQEPVNAQIIVYGHVKTTQQALTITPRLPAPVVKLFSVSPENISAGQSATLRWNVSGVTEVMIEPIGTQPPSGTKQVPIQADTSFRLSAKGASGETIDKTLPVKVLPANIELFEVVPAEARIGETVKIRWKVQNAAGVSIDGLGSQVAEGSQDYKVAKDQVFTLHVKVGDQEQIKIANLKVLAPAPDEFTVTPQNPQIGDKVTVRWKVSNASSVTVEPFGVVPATGEREVVVTGSTTFSLKAGNGQTLSELGSVSVSATAKPPKITAFRALPVKPRSGQQVNLSWQSENGEGAELTGIPGQGTQVVPPSGSIIFTAPEAPASLTLSVKGSDGVSVSQALALPVLPPLPVAALAVTNPSVQAGQVPGRQGAMPPVAVTPAGRPTTPAVIPAATPAVKPAQVQSPPVQPPPARPLPVQLPTVQPSTVLPPVLPRPQIVSFTALPRQITAGQPFTLAWNTKNVAQVRIQPLGKTFGPNGALAVKPDRNTVYTLTAIPAGGSATGAGPLSGQASVMVRQPAPMPRIIAFTPSASSVRAGQAITLIWDTKDAKQVKIYPGGKAVGPSGSLVVKPDRNTIYTLVAGSGIAGPANAGRVSQQLSVSVEAVVAAPPPPGASTSGTNPAGAGAGATSRPVVEEFSVSPSRIHPGDTVTITWKVSGVRRLSISHLGNQNAAGQVERRLNFSTAYVLRTGTGDQRVERRVAVEVVDAAVPLAAGASPDSSSAAGSNGDR